MGSRCLSQYSDHKWYSHQDSIQYIMQIQLPRINDWIWKLKKLGHVVAYHLSHSNLSKTKKRFIRISGYCQWVEYAMFFNLLLSCRGTLPQICFIDKKSCRAGGDSEEKPPGLGPIYCHFVGVLHHTRTDLYLVAVMGEALPQIRLIYKKSCRPSERFKQPLLLPQCPLCLLEMISSSTTPTADLSKIPNTLLLFSSMVSHFIPVCKLI